MDHPLTIIVTQGDPGGIGPEIVVSALRTWPIPADCRVVVLGYPSHFAQIPDRSTEPFAAWSDSLPRSEKVSWANPGPEKLDRAVELGRVSSEGAHAALRCIQLAARAALDGRADAIVTAPISKEGLAAIGSPYPGHTEFLGKIAGIDEVAMMLVGGGLRVILATIHEPLARVPELLSVERLTRLFALAHASLRDFGLASPRIAVAGLNPHAGEAGRFGSEEIEIIGPAIEVARQAGTAITGPYPADTIFHRARSGEFDAVVAMYHDQGLIPVKTLDFHGGVNVTLGLPFVRTSPDHGTAYDIAGRGVAHPGSMIAALNLACELARARRRSRAVPAA